MATDQQSSNFFEEEALSTTHSFILRFWLEETSTETRRAVWRGRITHVPSNAQVYVKDLDEVIAFINAYIHIAQKDSIDAKPSLADRIERLLRHWLR